MIFDPGSFAAAWNTACVGMSIAQTRAAVSIALQQTYVHSVDVHGAGRKLGWRSHIARQLVQRIA
jgi:hypothetical protein